MHNLVSQDFITNVQRKISQHLIYNYRVPVEVYSQELDNINYTVQIVLNEHGRITESKITHKSAFCGACEKELLMVLKKMPAIEFEEEQEKVSKMYLELPFRINIQ